MEVLLQGYFTEKGRTVFSSVIPQYAPVGYQDDVQGMAKRIFGKWGLVNMKLWEVLKELDENPNKRFKSVNYNQEEIIISMGTDCYDLPFRVIDSSRDWQEVKQPVTWQEAFEAWLNGTPVYCILENGKKVEYDQNINFIHAHSLKTGTWYIED